MSSWTHYLTSINDKIINSYLSNRSTSIFIPFEDSLSKSLTFNLVHQKLKTSIPNNKVTVYTDFNDNNISDTYKISSIDKFLKIISINASASLATFGSVGISFKYDKTELDKQILNNTQNNYLIFLIQHWEWLDNKIQLFLARLINNSSHYEKTYNKKIIIVIGDKNDLNSSLKFQDKLDIHKFELNDLKNILNHKFKNLQQEIPDTIIETLYPLTEGNLEKIYNLTTLSINDSKIEQLLDDLLSKIEDDFKKKELNTEFIYMLSVLPEYFNPYDVEEYFNLKTFQIEKAVDILSKLLVLTSVENRENFYSMIFILKEKLLTTINNGRKEIYQKYYQYICNKDPFNYKLKIDILSKFETDNNILLALYLLWYEHIQAHENIFEKEILFNLEYLNNENKKIFKKYIHYTYSTDVNYSLYEEELPENSLLSSILLKNDINFQGHTKQSSSFNSLCNLLYENILEESKKNIKIEPIHYLSCIYMLLPHLIDKLNQVDKFQNLNECIVKKFYITRDIEESAQYLLHIYKRKSFLYKTNDIAINDANIALRFFRNIGDEIEQYYTLGSLLGMYIVASDYIKANQIKQEIINLYENHNKCLPMYWKSLNNFIVLNFLSTNDKNFEYWKQKFEDILTNNDDLNDVTIHLIYTNLCSISLYYSNITEYEKYKRCLEQYMNVENLSDINDPTIDDFYRYYFGWFEFCELLLKHETDNAKRQYNKLKDFYPTIFESQKILFFEKHRRYGAIFDKNINTGKEFSNFLLHSRQPAKEWNYYRMGLMVTDIQYTSAL